MKQQTVSKLGKEYDKAVYCHPAYLTSMQNTSCEILSWPSSRLLRKMSVTSIADDTTLMAESEEELKSLLTRVKEKSERTSIKLNIKKLNNKKSWHPAPLLHGK